MDALCARSEYSIKPLLTRYAVPRTGCDEIPGAYSDQEGMWLVDTPDGPRPIIEVGSDLAELTTKTKVNAESDDKAPGTLLELSTKTEVKAESDDQRAVASVVLALTTKTSAQLESDDVRPRGAEMW